MESRVASTYFAEDEKSTSKAIIEWPDGLSAPPIIRALGDSLEESEQIRTLLERLFGNGQPAA